jgi:hypothetical protein
MKRISRQKHGLYDYDPSPTQEFRTNQRNNHTGFRRKITGESYKHIGGPKLSGI